jgi:hypothetical protein
MFSLIRIDGCEVFMENSQAQNVYERMKQGILHWEFKPGCPIIETDYPLTPFCLDGL